MWVYNIALLLFANHLVNCSLEDEEPIQYYYGVEESERELPACVPRQACGALLRRYWRAPAALRLCACARRQRCGARAQATLPLNNRAEFQFCESTDVWEECRIGTAAVSAPAAAVIDPDVIAALHDRQVALSPPNVTFHCRCRQPSHWRELPRTTNRDIAVTRYACHAPGVCRRDARCGVVSGDLLALYQSCLCPPRHGCLPRAGGSTVNAKELLYEGRGYPAYCTPLTDNVGDYYDYY